MLISSSLAIFRYEFKRSFSLGPLILCGLLIAFPTFLQLLIDQAGSGMPSEFSGILLVGTIPGAVCLLTILSSMAPYLNSELEGNTWPYVAVRPHGRISIMLGKYMVSVTRSIINGLLAIALVFPSTSLNELNREVPPPITTDVATGDFSNSTTVSEVGSTDNTEVNASEQFVEIEEAEPYPLWLSLVILVILSSFCYSTLFCLLGTVMYKRPMVSAIIYTLLIEGVISILPAVVNAVTINYYLRSIFLRLMGWELTDLPNAFSFLNDPNIFSQMGTFGDLISLGILCSSFLIISGAMLRNREYHVSDTL